MTQNISAAPSQTSPSQYGPYAPGLHDSVDAANAAASTLGALHGMQPVDPVDRALVGFQKLMNESPQPTNPTDAAKYDALANAQRILSGEADLGPNAARIQDSVTRIGNAILDGRVSIDTNTKFQTSLYSLATENAGSSAFNGADAELTRIAQVVDQGHVAPGTRLVYDARGNTELNGTGLPKLGVQDLDADLYFRGRDGTLNIESVKSTANNLASHADKAHKGALPQFDRQALWRDITNADGPRQAGFFALDPTGDSSKGFMNLTQEKNLA